MLRRPPEWTLDAACVGLSSASGDLWHPDDHKLPPAQVAYQYALARRVCAGCPVRLQCALHGMSLLPVVDVEGMFGGLTPTELRREARRLGLRWQKEAQHGSRSRYVAGCRCAPCTRSHREYEAERRARVRLVVVTVKDPPMLLRARGRGRWRVTEGQFLLFDTEVCPSGGRRDGEGRPDQRIRGVPVRAHAPLGP